MEYTDRDHFIPFSREQVIRMIIDNGDLIVDERSKFELFCKLLKSIYHFEFHEDLEDLKTSYRLFNPDMNSNEDERQNLDPLTAENNCINRIEKILIDGNYKEVSGDELDTALNEEGIFPVSAEVEFDSFEFYKIYFQGEKRGKSEIKSWIPFKKKEVEFEYYERIVFFFKVKTDAYFRTRKKISVPGTPEKIYLKYFRNIPKSDLEMIFPNLKPRMKTVHKMKIAIPLITGFVIAMQKFLVGPYLLGMGGNPLQEGVSVGLIVLLAGLAGYVFKTYNGYRKVVQKFLSEITQSLYFKDIGNNQGVLTALVDGAEEEEFKEATMAYYFLLKSDQKLTEPELDNLIEEWLEEKHNVKVDFEVDDALGKLEKLNLLERDDRGVLSVPSLDEALRRMDFIWDNYFDYNRAEAT